MTIQDWIEKAKEYISDYEEENKEINQMSSREPEWYSYKNILETNKKRIDFLKHGIELIETLKN